MLGVRPVIACASAAAVLGACVTQGAPAPRYHTYRALRGSLATADTTFLGARGRYALYAVRLTSSTGLVATGRLLQPARGSGPYPGVLLNDGRELNSAALDFLPADFGDVVVLSLDYPPDLPYRIDAATFLRQSRQLRESARQIPAMFSLGAVYLERRADVDSARIALAATSFAVPFGVIAAALDSRFRNVALVYGAGDLARVLAANLTIRPRLLRELVAWLITRPFQEFEPTRHIARIAPRQLVMVNGMDDPQMPRDAVLALYRAARHSKTLIWLRTGHLMPDDSVLIRQLVDTALARLPVLHEATDTSRRQQARSMGQSTPRNWLASNYAFRCARVVFARHSTFSVFCLGELVRRGTAEHSTLSRGESGCRKSRRTRRGASGGALRTRAERHGSASLWGARATTAISHRRVICSPSSRCRTRPASCQRTERLTRRSSTPERHSRAVSR